ncbi:MAG: hypothetical protein EA422_00180, partial [Gemmatimonadales bacterium]
MPIHRSLLTLLILLLTLSACGESGWDRSLEAGPDGPEMAAPASPATPAPPTGGAAVLPAELPAVQDPARLGHEVRGRAQALAALPWNPPEAALPPELQELDYDAYRRIRFLDERALWSGAGDFQVQFFHPGYLFSTPVVIHEVTETQVRPLPFDPDLFQYGVEVADGWAGWAG